MPEIVQDIQDLQNIQDIPEIVQDILKTKNLIGLQKTGLIGLQKSENCLVVG